MQHTIWYQIATTSWWTYVACGAILFITYKSTKPSIIPVTQLLIMPIIPLVFLCYFLVLHFSYNAIGSLAVTLFIVTFLSHYYLQLRKIPYHETEKTLTFPGTWLGIIILIAAIVAKYFYQFNITTLISDPNNINQTLLILEAFVGLLLGRATYALKKMAQVNAATCAGTTSARASRL